MADTTLLTPAYKLTFSQGASATGGGVGVPALSGGKVVDTTSEAKASTVVELKVVLDLDAPTDSLTLIMGQVGSFRPQKGDQVKVELGYADDDRGLFHVITADLTDIESGLTRRRLIGHASMHKLLANFANEHFEAKTAGELIEDLAGRAGVDVERAEAGSRFPAYVVDGRRSLYHHIRDLAGLCGFDVYVNPEGKLIFEKFVGGQTVHVFEFGKHILDLDVFQSEPAAPSVEAFGESPGTGPVESWAWLTKDFSSNKGTAGTGTPVFLLERPALRNAQAARNAARALNTHLTRAVLRGRLLLTGNPQVKLGDAIRLKSLPDESLNASFQVRSITHRIIKSAGFTTTIEFRSIA
jgi:phage protein D